MVLMLAFHGNLPSEEMKYCKRNYQCKIIIQFTFSDHCLKLSMCPAQMQDVLLDENTAYVCSASYKYTTTD